MFFTYCDLMIVTASSDDLMLTSSPTLNRHFPIFSPFLEFIFIMTTGLRNIELKKRNKEGKLKMPAAFHFMMHL